LAGRCVSWNSKPGDEAPGRNRDRSDRTKRCQRPGELKALSRRLFHASLSAGGGCGKFAALGRHPAWKFSTPVEKSVEIHRFPEARLPNHSKRWSSDG
jgi:hypothetical protein